MWRKGHSLRSRQITLLLDELARKSQRQMCVASICEKGQILECSSCSATHASLPLILQSRSNQSLLSVLPVKASARLANHLTVKSAFAHGQAAKTRFPIPTTAIAAANRIGRLRFVFGYPAAFLMRNWGLAGSMVSNLFLNANPASLLARSVPYVGLLIKVCTLTAISTEMAQ